MTEIYRPTEELPDKLYLMGQIFKVDDIDDMLEYYQAATQLMSELTMHRDFCKTALARAIAPEVQTKTRHLIGTTLAATITMPDLHYEQEILKDLYEIHPFAKRYLRVERVGVKKREFDKLRAGSGIEEVNDLKDAILKSESVSRRLPTVSIKENV